MKGTLICTYMYVYLYMYTSRAGIREGQKKKKKEFSYLSPFLFFLLNCRQGLGICQIVNRNGQEDVEENVWGSNWMKPKSSVHNLNSDRVSISKWLTVINLIPLNFSITSHILKGKWQGKKYASYIELHLVLRLSSPCNMQRILKSYWKFKGKHSWVRIFVFFIIGSWSL